MIKSNITCVCDSCGIETIDMAELIDTNPEWYAIGVSVHTLHEADWHIDLDTEACICPACREIFDY